ncbi:MAG: nucleoside hydrolase [Pseudonocardia sp.]|nr:nucleoside hydrolase [Pseudonocardia sp.]
MSPTLLVIDTDPGVDDAAALLLALTSTEVELRAVTTVFGNVELATTTMNARRLLTLASRSDIPVAAGAARPLVHPQAQRADKWHGTDGLGGRADTLPAATPLDPRGAVTLLADVLRAAKTPVTLAPIGPLTNIALLLAVHPELAGKIDRIVAMGGALRGGNTTLAAEFNIYADPEAAHRVLAEESVPITLVPLDITMNCWVDGQWLDELAAAGPRCATLAGVIDHGRKQHQRAFGEDRVVLHDAVAVLEAVVPGTLSCTSMPLSVECGFGADRGAVRRAESSDSRPVDVALSTDVPRLRAEILRRLLTLDGAAATA